jgi:uroporphyrinogen-III synthase
MSTLLAGRRVALFESRRASEMARLVERSGGVPLVAPTMREVPLEAGPAVRGFAAALRAPRESPEALDGVVLLTGVGTRALAAALAESGVMERAELAAHLGARRVAARGPKTVAALKELGVRGALTAPEPHTWRELLDAIRARWPLAGLRLALQEYGVPHPELAAALRDEGAEVREVPVYRWQLPEDTGPAERALDALLAGEVDAALFTSANQVDNLLVIADRRALRAQVVAALGRVLVGSVGPTCSERLRHHGIEPHVEPEHAHMGQLVRAVGERLAARASPDAQAGTPRTGAP